MKKYMYWIIIPVFAFMGGYAAQLSTTKALASAGMEPIFIYGADGQVRLQMGTYTAAGEAGLPLMGMSDNKGRLRMLFRLAGENESPVIIMKDRNGSDRIVMGLSLSGGSDAPFLSIVDDKGQKQNIFGSY